MKKLAILGTVLFLAFCGDSTNMPSSAQEAVHDHQAEDLVREANEAPAKIEEDHTHEDLHLTQKQQDEWGLALAAPSQESLASQTVLPGVLDLNQNKTAHISSFVQGKVVTISADLGDRVRRGQTLLVLNAPEFGKAQADFLEARARFLLSQKEYERAKMLFREKAIEEKEYLRREAEYEKLSTEYGAYGSALHSYGLDHEQIDALIEKCKAVEDEQYRCELADPLLPLCSPIAGTIILREAVVGEHVPPEKILFTASDLSTLWALLDAYEKDIPFISLKSRVVIKSSLYPERRFPGRITYISDLIDPKSRTIKVRVEVENRDGLLKPHMYIQGVIENDAGARTLLAVPEEAVQTLDGEKIVFIQETQNIFAVRYVKLGQKIGDKRIITQGLTQGEEIVVKGAFKLKSEISKATFGRAHVH